MLFLRRKNGRKIIGKLVLVGVLAIMGNLLGCKSNDSGKSKEQVLSDKELRVAGNEIAIGVDPTIYPAADYLLNMCAGEVLFKVDPKGVIRPYLAKEAKQLDDYTWQINLRPEAKFWSGDPVTAQAVINSLHRSQQLDLKANPHVADIAFTPEGTYVIKAVTKTPNLDVPMNLSNSQLLIHNTNPKYTYKDVATADYTGMYKIAEFKPAERMIFIRNENHWGEKPHIPKILHEQVSDSDARVMAALSGRYHVVMDIPQTACNRFTKTSPSHVVLVPGAQTQTIYLNSQKPSLQDYRVRQALGWAMDRDELILMGMEGKSEPVTTWLGSHPAFASVKKAFFDQCDIKKANKLLDEAGWKMSSDGYRYKDGKKLQFLLRTFRNDQALGETLQMQWKRIGVDVAVQHGDYGVITTARKTGDWDGSIEAWGTYGNITSLLKAQYAPNGAGNYGGYKDVKISELLEELDKTTDRKAKKQLAEKIAVYMAEQSPALYICPRPQISAVHNSLEGFVPHFRQYENVVNNKLRIKV
jgi:peptide/nickel transport system substrate-binding protein